MGSTAAHPFSPWPVAGETVLSGSAAEHLRQTVCRMPPLAVDRLGPEVRPALHKALGQLAEIVLSLRSPTSGWPADLPFTPETLLPYVGEEVGEVLDLLKLEQAAEPDEAAPSAVVPLPELIPHVLWMLASSSYEVMHLIEGIKSRVYHGETAYTVRVIRLVPVLLLVTDDQRYALDLATQTDPSPSLCLDDGVQLRLLDNDLDSQPIQVSDLLAHISELVGYGQPALHQLLTTGCPVMAVRPFQPWQSGQLRLHLHLADMGLLAHPEAGVAGAAPELADPPRATSPAFTLDDFAETLVEEVEPPHSGVFGDWLTVTDDAWVQGFLRATVQQMMTQGMGRLAIEQTDQADRELAWVRLAHWATGLVQGPNGLFKHTFVQDSSLVADVWPRLRWYLAQSSERVMQLMGGVPAQLLCPGRNWQQGVLSLRSLMHLTTTDRTWIIDLGHGRLLPAAPLALPEDTVVDTLDPSNWANHKTIGDLAALVHQDLTTHAPAIAALGQGVAVNLHRLETEEGRQDATLTLTWCFTWAYSAP